MVTWTDDPVRNFVHWDAEKQAELDRLPVCQICGEPIRSEHMYDILGDLWCQDCIDDARRLNEEVG